ncbi:hypothetical protein [Rhodococcus erythropolis]|uniref:hypothetical protein n=1 Tax=Rhodococcus erythropolis TaxID=1833 RepID=UPI0038246057
MVGETPPFIGRHTLPTSLAGIATLVRMELLERMHNLAEQFTRVIDVDNLALIPSVVLLVGVALLLLIESGFLLGLATPGNSLPITMGVLVAAGAVDAASAVIAVAVGSSAGAQLAFRRSRVSGTVVLPERLESKLPKLVVRWQGALVENVVKHPQLTTLCAHPVGAVRTVAPRLLAGSTLQHKEFALLNALAALVWATGLVTVGVLAGGSETFRTLYSFMWVPAVVIVGMSLMRRHFGSAKAAGVSISPSAAELTTLPTVPRTDPRG